MVGRSGGIAGSRSGEAGSIVGESGAFGGGESDGSVGCEEGESWKAADGGGEGVEPRIGGGEMDISLFSSQSRSSSTSFLRFLSFFRGGGALSGDCTSVACCGVGTAVRAAVGDVARTGTLGAVVVALPRLQRRQWRRRRFPAMAVDSAGAGKVHDSDSVWRPGAWLKTTRAFRPLAEHRSYSAVKSAAVTAGCCSGRVFSTTHDPSPLTTLAHVGVRGGL
jgi:hypothetical protein